MKRVVAWLHNKFKPRSSGGLESKYQAVFEFLETERSIELRRFRIVGKCYGFDTKRSAYLREFVDSIREIFELEKWDTYNNYLIWSKFGSGKSHFVKELGIELGNMSVEKIEINLAKIKTIDQLIQEIDNAKQLIDGNKKVFAYIDEVDCSISGQAPFEILFGSADWNKKGLPIVWVYMGSSGESFDEFLWKNITLNHKGPDFLSRVPNKLCIPPLTPGDKVILAASLALDRRFTRISRSALMTIAMDNEIQTARQIEQCIDYARGKLRTNELRYMDLFVLESSGLNFYKQNENILKYLDYNITIEP